MDFAVWSDVHLFYLDIIALFPDSTEQLNSNFQNSLSMELSSFEIALVLAVLVPFEFPESLSLPVIEAAWIDWLLAFIIFALRLQLSEGQWSFFPDSLGSLTLQIPVSPKPFPRIMLEGHFSEPVNLIFFEESLKNCAIIETQSAFSVFFTFFKGTFVSIGGNDLKSSPLRYSLLPASLVRIEKLFIF